MNLQELQNNGIKSPEELVQYLNRNRTGYYFLPNDITRLIKVLVNLNSPKRLINLNSNFGEILSEIDGVDYKIGVDINSDKVEIAKFLYPNLLILKEDPLSYEKNNNFESVVCFPPLAQRIEINGRAGRLEELYVTKGLSLLDNNGTAIFLLPNNFLTAPIYSSIRNEILKNYGLKAIISFPNSILRNTATEFSILEIAATSVENVSYYKYDLDKNIISKIKNNNPDFTIPKSQMNERWDYNFHTPENKEYEEILKQFDTKKIDELVEITLGIPFRAEERSEKGTYRILSPRNIIDGHIEASNNDKFLQRTILTDREKKAVLQDGDIVVTRFANESIGVYNHRSTDSQYIANQHLVILRGKNAEYVATYLNTKNGITLFNSQIKRRFRGNRLPTISIPDLKEIQIPILPIDDLELASKSKLEKLSYEELLIIHDKYINLKSKYASLKEESSKTPHEELLERMENTLNQVLDNQEVISTKLEEIKTTLNELSTDFKSIKELPRTIDEKIIRLQDSLDNKLSKLLIDQVEIDIYIKEIKRWFDYYDILEAKSQIYLPEAEYIFDQISKLKNPDYSPFILQYCRALENELLKKIFRAYVQSLIDREINIEEAFRWDFGRKELGKPNNENTFKLSKHLKEYLTEDSEEWFFELGSMEVNLRYLTGKTVKKSPLLQDLKGFILEKFGPEILNIEYLDEIKTIITDYRNESAHPNLIDAEKAVEFHKQIKECLINLMENYKK